MARALNILVLDDEPLILLDLQWAVECAGCLPLTACSCEEALSIVEQTKVDVAILDVSLGGGSNCAPVARRLAEQGIPFVFHTGDPRDLADDVRALGRAMLVKPTPTDKVVDHAVGAAR